MKKGHTKVSQKELFALNAYHIIIDGLFDSIPILLAFIVVAMGAGERDVGIIVSLTALFSTLAGLSTVYFSERYDFFKLIGCILFVYGLGYMIAAFSSSLLLIGASFVLATTGHGIFHNIAFSYYTDITAREKIGRAISDFTAIGDIGRIPLITLAGFCGGLVWQDIPGWRFVLFTYGLGAMLFFVAASRFFLSPRGKASSAAQPGPSYEVHFSSDNPAQPVGNVSNSPQGKETEQNNAAHLQLTQKTVCSSDDGIDPLNKSTPLNSGTALFSATGSAGATNPDAAIKVTPKILPSFALLHDKKVALTVLANMFNILGCGALFTFLPLLLLSKGLDPKSLGGFGLGFSIGCFLGKMLCGRLIDSFGSARVFVGSHLILACLLIAIVTCDSLAAVMTISMSMGIVTKGAVPIVQTIITEFIPQQFYKDIFSINSFFRGIVLILIPFFYGVISERCGIEIIYMIMVAASLMAIVPIAIVFRLKH